MQRDAAQPIVIDRQYSTTPTTLIFISQNRKSYSNWENGFFFNFSNLPSELEEKQKRYTICFVLYALSR